ncbi:MAG: site-specific DNA-methyltransferase (cytosine-specific) [Nitrospira sp.]|nr:MAG: site-specific DNA-methyltransferase (cytosine-specific) [Nitrospira sp.]
MFRVMETIKSISNMNEALEARFAAQMQVNLHLTRALVSFQANKREQGFRWFKYKEGFSAALIHYLLDYLGIRSGTVLDPFAGAGTTLFVASQRGLASTGIELLPIGQEIIEVRKLTLLDRRRGFVDDLKRWHKAKPWKRSGHSHPFPHLRITMGAFSKENEALLGRYLAEIDREGSEATRRLLRFAALCILEQISYTRKDGQYLRWDYRSGRKQGVKPFDKGKIGSFDEAIDAKLSEILGDLEGDIGLLDLFPTSPNSGQIDVAGGSCLEELPKLSGRYFDALITSPPYCNRYDYTRTYALELALLGVGEDGLKNLRQAMLSCTVENREKQSLLSLFEENRFSCALESFRSQECLGGILQYLDDRKAAQQLNNNGIPRMVRNYFWEMTLVIFECARILKPGAPLVMVNDNVRYEGANISVDLILSSIAESAGFNVEKIWVLPNGKGNSSQQMGEFGREALRKCVYIWRAPKAKPARKPSLQLAGHQ